MSVLDITNRNHINRGAFFDGDVGIQRYDSVKYPAFDKLTDKQLGFFWRPEEVDILRDAKDFKELTVNEQHIFTSNLKRQILLDSVQGRSPNLAFLPCVSLPEVETWIETWAFSETIHSRSYTHIIRNVYADPSQIFDELLDIKEIVDCADNITKHYDILVRMVGWYNLLGEGNHLVVSGKEHDVKKVNGNFSSVATEINVDIYELKKLLYLTLMSVNILEGVRFYVSFACSWAFAELKKMEGNAKIIKFIARDENVHLASTQQLLKLLPQEDKDFAKIKKETVDECTEMFVSAVEQEKQWADFLFKDGSMIGLNAQLLHNYIEWIANKRMIAIGLSSPFKVPQANPLPWTQKWISGGDVQVAPQETEISSYIIGGTKQDVNEKTFEGLSL
jgi:ribonucleoside-diphosphate reductase beta chain|tara:strand:+ start:246 stop:1418 length:1173 start_codon:yes stop_codon:yes gene_type:complete